MCFMDVSYLKMRQIFLDAPPYYFSYQSLMYQIHISVDPIQTQHSITNYELKYYFISRQIQTMKPSWITKTTSRLGHIFAAWPAAYFCVKSRSRRSKSRWERQRNICLEPKLGLVFMKRENRGNWFWWLLQ